MLCRLLYCVILGSNHRVQKSCMFFCAKCVLFDFSKIRCILSFYCAFPPVIIGSSFNSLPSNEHANENEFFALPQHNFCHPCHSGSLFLAIFEHCWP